MSDGSGAVTVEPRRRWLLFVAGGCVVFVAVVIGVAVWGGASSNEDCAAKATLRARANPCARWATT